MDSIEEIIKLKSLLDQGAITQEEFNSLKCNLISNLDIHRVVSDNEKNETEAFNNNKVIATQTSIPPKTVFQKNQRITNDGSSSKYLIILAIVIILFVAIGVSVSNLSSDSFSVSVETATNEPTSDEPAPDETYPDESISTVTTPYEPQSTNNHSVFKSESEVRQYLDGKTFNSNEDGMKISYGYISTANTYGITIENAKGATFYYINCNIRAYGSFCDISGMSPENGENFSFRAFKDNLVVGYGQAQSRKFYLE